MSIQVLFEENRRLKELLKEKNNQIINLLKEQNETNSGDPILSSYLKTLHGLFPEYEEWELLTIVDSLVNIFTTSVTCLKDAKLSEEILNLLSNTLSSSIPSDSSSTPSDSSSTPSDSSSTPSDSSSTPSDSSSTPSDSSSTPSDSSSTPSDDAKESLKEILQKNLVPVVRSILNDIKSQDFVGQKTGSYLKDVLAMFKDITSESEDDPSKNTEAEGSINLGESIAAFLAAKKKAQESEVSDS